MGKRIISFPCCWEGQWYSNTIASTTNTTNTTARPENSKVVIDTQASDWIVFKANNGVHESCTGFTRKGNLSVTDVHQIVLP